MPPRRVRSFSHRIGDADDAEVAITIDDPAVLKAFFDPLRYRIMKLLHPPKSVREVADELGMPPGRLYYHVDLLVRRGLVKVAEERVVGTNVERVYAPAATRFELADELADSPLAVRTSTSQMGETFDDHRRRVVRMTSGEATPRGDGTSRTAIMFDVRVKVTPRKAQAFADKVAKLVREMEEAGEAKGSAPYALLFVLASDDDDGGAAT